MARPSDVLPFNQRADTGRMGFRHEWEPVDDRPLVVYHEPLWADETERMTYEAAVEADRPREEDTLLDYLARISASVAGRYAGVLPKMRRPGQSRAERARSLAKLRGQYPSKMEIL